MVGNLSVCGCGGLAEFAHLAENHHLPLIVDGGEVAQRGMHRRDVGVVGIHHQAVVGGGTEFRAAVCGTVGLECGTHCAFGHTEVASHGTGCKHVRQVVVADEHGLHLVPCAVLHSPAEAEEGVARHHAAFDVIALSLSAVGDGRKSFGTSGKHGIVGMEKDERCCRADLAVRFGSGFGCQGFGMLLRA